MDRRRFVVGVGALAVVAVASPGGLAQAGSRSVDAKRVFDKLADYYSLAPQERSRFRPAYTLKAQQGAAPSLFLSVNGMRRPITVDVAGRVVDLPTADELKAGAEVVVMGETKMSSTISMEPVLALGSEIAAKDARAAIDQANAAIGKFAGLLGFMAPRVTGIGFVAPGNAGGTVVLGDGRTKPMPYADGHFEFKPAVTANAVSLKFLTPPSAAIFLN